jgi:RNA polymerase sigma factor (sigma-70 family)
MSIEINSDTDSLWDKFLTGDDKAFAGIYYAIIQSLLSYGNKLTQDRDMLRDSVQEIFLDLYQKRGKHVAPIHKIKPYLMIALKNSILKKLHQGRKFEDLKVDDHLMGEFYVEYSFQDQLISRETSDHTKLRLQQAISTLSSRQKEIIYLKFEEELGYREIALMMNITVESARKQLYRALFSLKETLDSEVFHLLFCIFLKKSSKVVHV